jgi:hypothetical protein
MHLILNIERPRSDLPADNREDPMSTFWRRRTVIGTALMVAAGLLWQQPVVAAAPSTLATACNLYCDARDAAQATSDRVPVTITLFGRTFGLHISDADTMGWGSISGGRAGDEVWLDRSFDGGRSWAAGSALGRTGIPAGAAQARTTMFNVDEWSTRGVGLLRACGKAADRTELVCTAWARSTWNAGDRRTAAATALMMRFDRGNAMFDGNGWWTGANALTALIDNIRVTGMRSYEYAITASYDRLINERQGQFRNEYSDDTGWWGLAWVAAYDLTGNVRYLNTARAGADHMHTYWDARCGGGVYWRSDRTSKDAISNSLYIQLNAALARRIAGDVTYRGRAQTGWSWFQGTGMITNDNTVINHVDLNTCRGVSGPLTYTQGVLINALVQLNRLTGDAVALAVARRIADAATVNTHLHRNGIVREPGETDSCSGDAPAWKGAYIRGIGALNAATGGAYDAYLKRQAASVYAANRNSFDAYGPHWSGPFVGTSHLCQLSALDLLNVAP